MNPFFLSLAKGTRMEHVVLMANWRLLGTEPAGTPPENLPAPALTGPDWLAATVPGDINADLLRHGKIPDPHHDDNARRCYWITSKDWWYHTSFDADQDAAGNAVMVFETLDGTADVFLNGRYLGTAANAFRPWRFAGGKILKRRDNQLFVRFRSLDLFFGGPREDELAGWGGKRAFLRKPQFSFGWDWALPLPSLGIGGAVRLELNSRLCLADCAIKPFADGRVDFAFEVSPDARRAGYAIEIAVTGHGVNVSSRLSRLAGGGNGPLSPFKSYCSVRIPNPRLWYPNGFGEQPLYDYEVRLIVNGEPVDLRKGRIGLRETKIVEQPFAAPFGDGMSFNIAINGSNIFCKGSNWVPLELWPASAKEDQYRFYLRKAKEAGFNMLRVWGGGIYERDIFYDLCDEYGIMVWQDFMFASTGYPLDVLQDEIVKEAEYQIRRLRNRPCVVLWCGCNEDACSWSHPLEGASSVQEDTGVYAAQSKHADRWAVNRFRDDPRLYGVILRGLVGRLGLDVPYVESSPASRDDYGNVPASGNCHISAWKYVLFQPEGHSDDFRRHFDQVCSFNSEFCDQGPCSVAAFKRFLAPENLWPPNDIWTYHLQKGHKMLPHHEQTLLIAGGIFGPINSLEDYVKYGQATHLEMTRCEFEAARRDRPNCGGTMSWMFNDCWPTANWAIIDYYRSPKPAYYASKRACAPVLAIVFPRAGNLEFFVDNQTPRSCLCRVVYGLETLAGRRIWEKQQELTVPENRNVMVDRMPEAAMPVPLDAYWFINAEVEGAALPRQCYFPHGWKNVAWPDPRITAQSSASTCGPKQWETDVLIETDVFARLCHLAIDDAAVQTEFSDNYFDLPAGARQTVAIRSNRQIHLKNLRIGHWRGDWF